MKSAEMIQNIQEQGANKSQRALDQAAQNPHLQGLGALKPQRIVSQVVQDPETQGLSVIKPQTNGEQIKQQDTQEMSPLKRRPGMEQGMQERHVLDIIKQRRSIGQVTQEMPSQEQIECMLEAATYAPNHHVTEPWRFFVVTGGAREELGAIMAASLRMNMNAQELSPEKKQLILWKERNKPLRAPVIITVAVPGSRNVQGLFIENVAAASAAIQNMLLAGEAMGLGTLWRTGEAAFDPLVKRWFGLAPEDHIAGFIYTGYPKVSRAMRTPTPFAEKTMWLS